MPAETKTEKCTPTPVLLPPVTMVENEQFNSILLK